MVHNETDFAAGVAHDFEPNRFYRQIKRQSDTETALRATHDLIIMLSCLRNDKTYKDLMDEWTDKD